ncbi:tautomerase family protein [Microlunatus soli]|uniref:Tautomerase enzyme n=1 Tax=Microlunatus soli TaxID=630515 RepID=A0A1H1TWU7_9ACTN|nr:tautomerase family protein [Microlunatus soli]SDS64713.1 Tautomerase enzyme [Microlunatus soli]
MPHARIDLHKVHQPRLKEFSDAILEGMVRGLDMPRDDLFQIFRLHEPGELVFSPTHPRHQRDDIIFIELLAQVGYSDEQKQAAMTAIADELAQLGIKRDNVLLVVAEVHGAAWLAAGPDTAAA